MNGKRQDRDLYTAGLLYFGLSSEEWDELNELYSRLQSLTPEENERWVYLDSQNAFLPAFLVSKDESEVESFKQLTEEVGAPLSSVVKIGEADGYIYFYAENENTKVEGLRPQYAEEFRKLVDIIREAAPKAEFFAPIEPEDPWIGRMLTFETTDLDGNTVRSEELFAKHDITMLNFWATWCEPCKGELRELGEINRRMQAENCAIVGILNDEDSEETIELGKALLEENGVDYLNLKMPAVLDESKIAVSLPTSVFVDSNGVIIAPLVKGAFVNLYETKFHELLDGTQPAAADAVVENNNGAYRVIVSDQDGNPVKGVVVQFCSDVTCTLAKTDADGLASFDADEGQVYTIHILKVPEGFEKNNEEFRTLETYCDTKIVIQKTA
jgi:thiol-disulfide isomerase/thioredoxin